MCASFKKMRKCSTHINEQNVKAQIQRHKLSVTLSVATHALRCAQHSAGESLRRLRRDSHLHWRAVPVSLLSVVQNDIVFLMLCTPPIFISE